MINRTLISLLILFTVFSCKKKPVENINPPIAKEPVITLESVTPTTVHQFTDSIVFNVKFIDGDGDLGDFSADSLSLALIDNRSAALEERFHIAPAAPVNVTVAVQGVYHIVLDHTIFLNSASTSESTTFTVHLKDRAGHWSNVVNSGTITILP